MGNVLRFRRNMIPGVRMKTVGKWKKKFLWFYFKITNEKATPEYVARGWAIGMFFGCFIPFGLQLICSVPTSFLLRGSKIGATLGTLITNPVTILFIYPAQCWVGSRIIGKNLSYETISNNMDQVINHTGPWYEAYSVLVAQGMDIVLSFFAGGALLSLIMTPLTYFVILSMIRNYIKMKALRREQKSGI